MCDIAFRIPNPGNALSHRDIPKRYILTFLKRDGHVRLRTIDLRIDPTSKASR